MLASFPDFFFFAFNMISYQKYMISLHVNVHFPMHKKQYTCCSGAWNGIYATILQKCNQNTHIHTHTPFLELCFSIGSSSVSLETCENALGYHDDRGAFLVFGRWDQIC